MSNLDAFWAEIDRQLEDLKSATTPDDVFRICPPVRGLSEPRADGFFAGGGGDGQVSDSLRQAGWATVMWQASYYWVMANSDGEKITYIEGDLYRGDTTRSE